MSSSSSSPLSESRIPKTRKAAMLSDHEITEAMTFIKHRKARDYCPATGLILETLESLIHDYSDATLLESTKTYVGTKIKVLLDQRKISPELRGDMREKDVKVLDTVLFSQQLLFCARYGDYLKLSVDKIRQASKSNVGELLFKRLDRLTDELANEDSLMRTWKNLSESQKAVQEEPFCPVAMAIHSAAASLHIDGHHAAWVIRKYASRNDLFHRDIRELITTGSWEKLAAVLEEDIKNVPLIVSPGTVDVVETVTLLEGLRDEFFEVIDDGEEEPDWLVKKEKVLEQREKSTKARIDAGLVRAKAAKKREASLLGRRQLN